MPRPSWRAGVVLALTVALLVPAGVAAPGAAAAAPTDGPTEPVESGVVLAGGGAGWGGSPLQARLESDPRMDRSPSDGALWVVDGPRTGLLAGGLLTVVASNVGETRDVAARSDGSAYVLTSSALLSVARSGTTTTVALLPAGFAGRRLAVLSDGRPVVAASARVMVLGAGGLVDLGAQPWHGIADIANGPAGSLYVSTAGADNIWVWRRDAEGVVTKVAGTGTGGGRVISPEQPSVPALSYGWGGGVSIQVHPTTGEVWLTSPPNDYGTGYAPVLRVTSAGVLSAAVVTGERCEGAGLAGTGSTARLMCRATDGLVVIKGLTGTAPPFATGPVVAGAAADAESADGLAATESYLPDVRDVAMTSDGTVWLATSMGLRFIDGAGALRTAVLAGSPSLPDGVATLAADGAGVIVATGADHVLRVVPGPGGPAASAVTEIGSGWSSADDVAVHDGAVYVADSGLAAVRRVEGTVTTDVMTGRTFSSVAAGPRGVAASFSTGIVEKTPDGERQLSNTFGGTLGAWDGRWLVGGSPVRDIRPDGAIGVLLGHATGGRRAEGHGSQVLIAEAHRAIRVTEPAPSWVPPTPTGLTPTARPGYAELAWEAVYSYRDDVDVRRGAAPLTAWHTQTGVCAGPVRTQDGSARIWCDRAAIDGLVAPDVDYAATVHRRAYVSVGPSTVVEVQAAPVTVTAHALADDGPPPAPTFTSVSTGQWAVALDWSRPAGVPDRLDRDIVRFKAGTSPPTSPTDGLDGGVTEGHALVSRAEGLEPDTDYTFAVFSIDYRGNVSDPAVTTVRLDTTGPGPVTDVTVTTTYRAATVSWAEPGDPDLRGTVVQIVPAGAPMTEDGCAGTVDSTTVSRGGLVHGTAYTVWLRTCDDFGNSGEPIAASFTTPTDSTPPAPPTDVAAAVSGKTITVTWTPPDDPEFGGVFVRLAEGDVPPAGPTDGIGVVTTGGTPPSAVFRNLKGSTTYTAVAFARDQNGNDSEPSQAVTVVTDADTTAPTLSANAFTGTPLTNGTVQLRLTPPFPIFDFAGVHLTLTPPAQEPANPGDGTVLADLLCTSLQGCTRTITLPAMDEPFRVTAWPFDVTGNVGLPVAITVQGSVANPDLPGTPWGVQAFAVDQNQLRVRWQGASPGAGSGGAITRYEIEVDQRDGGLAVGGAPAYLNQADVRGLQGGAELAVRVYAVNAAGRSLVPGRASGTPTDALIPSPVAGVTAVGRYGGATDVTWTPSPSFDVSRYDVRWATGTAALATPTDGAGVSTTGSSVTLPARASGSDLRVAVFAVDWAGNYSPPRSALVRGTKLSIGVSPTTVVYGSPTRASGRLLRADGVSLAGQRVTVRRRLSGSTSWATLGTAVTSANGSWSLSVSVSRRAEVEAYHANSAYGWSKAAKVVGVSLAVKAKAPTSKRYRTSLAISGSVRPAKYGRPLALQRYWSGQWRTVARGRTTSTGSFTLTTKPPRGTWSLRVVAASDAYYKSGKSLPLRVRIY